MKKLRPPSGPLRDRGADVFQDSVAQANGIALAAERCVDHVYRYQPASFVGLKFVSFGRKRAQRLVVGLSRKTQIVGCTSLGHAEELPKGAKLGINAR